MYDHVRPNVLNERDPGHQCGAPVGIDPGSLSQHMALIFPPPACLSSSFLRPLRRQRLTHELCGNIDQLIESYCVEPWVIIEGRITPTLVLRACPLRECIIQLCVTHTHTHALPLAHLRFVTATQAFEAHTAAFAINTAQMTACIDWLPFAIMLPLFTFQYLTHSNGIQ